MTLKELLESLEGYDRRSLLAETLGEEEEERKKNIEALQKNGWKVIEHPPLSGIYDLIRAR